jgi:hypothetical protein
MRDYGGTGEHTIDDSRPDQFGNQRGHAFVDVRPTAGNGNYGPTALLRSYDLINGLV